MISLNVNYRNITLLIVLTVFISGCSTFSSNQDENAYDSMDSIPANVPATNKPASRKPTRLAKLTNETPETADQPSVNEAEYTNIWDRLIALYQLDSNNNAKIIQIKKRHYLKHKAYMKRISARSQPYLFLIVEEIQKRGLPGELALLPVVESEYRVDAYSHGKASGLWQFVPATGRHFGLKQNWWYDGRRDVLASTNAALKYLQQLNDYYKGDWLLALAAYNAGAGTVDKAIRKNRKKGLQTDYWSLDLPRETTHYIPKLLAIAEIIKNYKAYDLPLQPVANKPFLVRVNIGGQVDISMAAEIAGISIDEFHKYNPAFKQWATDPDGPHYLLLPMGKTDDFNQKVAALNNAERINLHRHKIKPGESLGVIAQKYHVSVKSLKKSNGLKSSRIRAGKYLMIPVSNSKVASATPAINPQGNKKSTTRNHSTYKVTKGDSFWTIARKYRISHNKLASINGLSINSTLAIDQELIMPARHNQAINAKNSQASAEKRTRQISYKVRKGDSLYRISRQFKVSINDLKNWNQIQLSQNKYLKPGQRLTVYIDITG